MADYPQLPCQTCPHLREATSPAFKKLFMVCGWWDDLEQQPNLRPVTGVSTEGSRAVPIRRMEMSNAPPVKTCPMHPKGN